MRKNLAKRFFKNDIVSSYTISILFAVISLGFWYLNWVVGVFLILMLGSFLTVITNNVKYLIPTMIFGVMAIGGDVRSEETVVSLGFAGVILVIVIGIHMCRNYKKIDFDGNSIGLLLLAISMAIPILWVDYLVTINRAVVAFYFAGFLYLGIYLLFKTTTKPLRHIIIMTFALLPVLLSGQLLIDVLLTPDWFNNFSNLAPHLGWGNCNEAAILICFSLPFVFYKILTSKKKVFFIIFAIISCGGIFLTFSRAGYLFFGMEVILLLAYLVAYSKIKRRTIIILSTTFFFVLITGVILLEHFTNMLSTVFEQGLASEGRMNLYSDAFYIWTEDVQNFIFGSGLITKIDHNGNFIVYHSTLFETLVAGGLVLACSLIYHLYEKYRRLFNFKNTLFICILISFIVVDLYGLIDNTYYMYYYMIPLVMVLAMVDQEVAFINKQVVKVNSKKIKQSC